LVRDEPDVSFKSIVDNSRDPGYQVEVDVRDHGAKRSQERCAVHDHGHELAFCFTCCRRGDPHGDRFLIELRHRLLQRVGEIGEPPAARGIGSTVGEDLPQGVLRSHDAQGDLVHLRELRRVEPHRPDVSREPADDLERDA
jgi:hypothetical protein